MIRLLLAAVAVSFVAVAQPAVAKSETSVYLLTPIPLTAREGTTLRVAWRIRTMDGSYSYGHMGTFVRLVSRSGDATEGFSRPTRDPMQAYEADVVVPRGEISRVEFGVAGVAQGSRSDVLIPVANTIRTADEIRPDGGPMSIPPPHDLTVQQDLASLLVIAALIVLLVAGANYLSPDSISASRRWK